MFPIPTGTRILERKTIHTPNGQYYLCAFHKVPSFHVLHYSKSPTLNSVRRISFRNFQFNIPLNPVSVSCWFWIPSWFLSKAQSNLLRKLSKPRTPCVFKYRFCHRRNRYCPLTLFRALSKCRIHHVGDSWTCLYIFAGSCLDRVSR